MNSPENFQNYSSELNADEIFSILPSQATLEQAKTFLAARNLSYSAGSWSFMIEQRIKPAIVEGKLSLVEIADLLAQAEEHGKQHVLLYKLNPKNTASIFSPGHVAAICASEPKFPPFNQRRIIDIPEKPTIVEIREDSAGDEAAIVVKSIEKRYVRDENSFKQWEDGGKLYTSVDTRPYRAANVVRIRKSGLCEVRIHSHMDAYEYEIEARGLLNSLDPLIAASVCNPYSLRGARHYVCDPKHRKSAMEVFDLKHTEHLDLTDGRLRPSVSGPGFSMLTNTAITEAMDAFQRSEGTVQRAGLNVRPGKFLRRGLNLGLSGADNEFFLTAKITRAEYEYVLETVLEAIDAMASK